MNEKESKKAQIEKLKSGIETFFDKDTTTLFITNYNQKAGKPEYYCLLMDRKSLNFVEQKNQKTQKIHISFEKMDLEVNGRPMTLAFLAEFSTKLQHIVSDIQLKKAIVFKN